MRFMKTTTVVKISISKRRKTRIDKDEQRIEPIGIKAAAKEIIISTLLIIFGSIVSYFVRCEMATMPSRKMPRANEKIILRLSTGLSNPFRSLLKETPMTPNDMRVGM